jgi:hypothetical protein
MPASPWRDSASTQGRSTLQQFVNRREGTLFEIDWDFWNWRKHGAIELRCLTER